MKYNKKRVEDAVLALLQLTATEGHEGSMVAWKNYSWDVTDALHQQGYLGDPKGKSKSLVLTKEGAERSRQLFQELFGDTPQQGRSPQ